jgi:hypothetical protein
VNGDFELLTVDVDGLPRYVPKVLGNFPSETGGPVLDKDLNVDYVPSFVKPCPTGLERKAGDVVLDNPKSLDCLEGCDVLLHSCNY